MELPTHPLLTLVERNANCLKQWRIQKKFSKISCTQMHTLRTPKYATGLKSMLTHYIDETVDKQFASLKDSILLMIQSGQIDIDPQNYDVAILGTTLPPSTQANTDQSSAQCSHEYSNDTLTRAQKHQNILQNEVSLANPINTDEQMSKQKFDDEDDDGQEIDNDNVAKCENCEKGICNSVRENYGYSRDTDTRLNDNEPFEIQHNFNAAFENNQINPSIISNDILSSPSHTNPTNAEPLIKQECLQDLSITSILLNFTNNAALKDIAIDEQIEGQNTQFQTDELDDNDDVDDDYSEGGGDEYLNQPNWDDCANGDCDFDLENNNNHLNNVFAGDGNETDIETNLDEAQSQIEVSVTNNTQMNCQNEEENVINERSVSVRNMKESTSSTSGVRSPTRKLIQTKVLGDLVQSNVRNRKSGKRKSDQANKNVKKAKRKQILDDSEDHANNTIEEEIATECTTSPIQPNRHLQCSHCLKSFDHQSKLQTHLPVHTGERSFQCDQCNKNFRKLSNLTQHQLIHQNIKRFRCHDCERQFTQKSNLLVHLRKHSGDRPFACRHCDKSFTTLGNRNKHEQAIHLHVKRYRCKQCGHTATHQSNIISHVRVVHFGLPRSIKEQRALNIIDDRDPKELVEKV